jgi:serine/threonine protein kinase/Tfp pilus assembly protein PilF
MPSDHPPADRRAAEIIQTWLDGAVPDALGVLAAHPEFAADKAIALDLAYAEFLVRQMRGEAVDPEEFCARFPAYHASLGRMLAQQSVGGPAADRADGLGERTVQIPITPVASDPDDPLAKSAVPPSSGPATTPGSTGASGPPRAPVWPAPGAKVGDFNLLRQMGKGAFGRVFLALEEPTTKTVVVKVTRQKCDEAKVLGKLGHGNVVSVLSAPHDPKTGLYLIVMPFLGTATFEDLLEVAHPKAANQGPPKRADVILTAAARNYQATDPKPTDLRIDPILRRGSFVDGIVWLGVRVADALAAVHQCGFVHHDLKPSNVLIGLDGQPRLLDFNLASDVLSTKSRLGGTLPYMPPEHLEAVRKPDRTDGLMDIRGDVYSLGVILFELLTGVHPFGRFPKSKSVRTVATEMLARQKAGTKAIRELNPAVTPRLARLVEKCLAFHPAHRPQTAAAVAAELRRCHTMSRRARQFLTGRPGRALATASAIAVVSTGSWYAATKTRAAAAAAPVNYRDVGMAALAQGKMPDAPAALSQAVTDNPNDADAWLALARGRLAAGEWGSARDCLDRVVVLRPDHGPAHATLGYCLAALNRSGDALAAFDRAEAAGFRPAGLDALRAYVHNKLRDPDQAATAIGEALAKDPNHRGALIAKGTRAYTQAIKDVKPVPAADLADVERVLAAAPPDANTFMWAARMYAWSAYKPPHAKADWSPNAGQLKERARQLLRLAVENGHAETWMVETAFLKLFGEPRVFAKDWTKPAVPRVLATTWELNDPLKEFAG